MQPGRRSSREQTPAAVHRRIWRGVCAMLFGLAGVLVQRPQFGRRRRGGRAAVTVRSSVCGRDRAADCLRARRAPLGPGGPGDTRALLCRGRARAHEVGKRTARSNRAGSRRHPSESRQWLGRGRRSSELSIAATRAVARLDDELESLDALIADLSPPHLAQLGLASAFAIWQRVHAPHTSTCVLTYLTARCVSYRRNRDRGYLSPTWRTSCDTRRRAAQWWPSRCRDRCN